MARKQLPPLDQPPRPNSEPREPISETAPAKTVLPPVVVASASVAPRPYDASTGGEEIGGSKRLTTEGHAERDQASVRSAPQGMSGVDSDTKRNARQTRVFKKAATHVTHVVLETKKGEHNSVACPYRVYDPR